MFRRLNSRPLLCAGALLVAAAASASAPAPTDRELRVGVFQAPPYAMKSASGEWRGLTVDLWKQLAADLGLRYRFEELSEEAILEALAKSGLDLAAAPFGSTMERQRITDFTQAYLSTGLGLAVRRRSRTERLLDVFRTVADSEALHLLLAIGLLSLLAGAAVWLAERRRNPQFPV